MLVVTHRRVSVDCHRICQLCRRLDAIQSSAAQQRQDGVLVAYLTVRRQHRLPTSSPTIGSFTATPSSTVHNLGVYIDADLSMQSHVRRTVSRRFAALRELRSIRRQTTCGIPVADCRIGPFTTELLQWCSVWTACSHPRSPIYSECCCAAYLRNPPVRAHHQRALQPTLAARSRAHLLQTDRPDIPSHPRHRAYISVVMFHSSCRHDVQTTAAILNLSATGSAARSHYCRQTGVPSFCS